jgi:PII-like signaling protein
MKKVELIFESIYTKKLLKIFKHHGVSGYTIIRDIEGYGEHGLKSADDVTDVGSNILLFSVCEAEVYEKMDKDIRAFLHLYGGKCILTDVMLLLGKIKK